MEEIEPKKNIIVDLTFQFALDAIKCCEKLEERKKYVIAGNY